VPSGHGDKRQLLLDAAVRVFARKGFHGARVGDISAEAGVSHGLLYHYFASKDDVLECIFRETWGAMIQAIELVEETEPSPREQLRKTAAIVLRSWRNDPDLVRVLVREIARSPHLQQEVGEIEHAFDALQRIVERGQASGDFDASLDPRLAATIVYGVLEQILTGWVLGRLPGDEEDVTHAEQTVVRVLAEGLVGTSVAAAA
jgi:AcrR family transcriptional regulator